MHQVYYECLLDTSINYIANELVWYETNFTGRETGGEVL